MEELKLRIQLAKEKPQIIMVNEVKPKNSRFSLSEAEISLDKYHLITKNIDEENGRGIAIYIRIGLRFAEVEINSTFQESLWFSTRLKNNDEMLAGCIYRSPNSSDDNSKKLRDLIKDVSNKKYSHLMVAGDFNYPNIKWTDWTTPGDNPNSEDFLFIEELRSSYLHQHVEEATRGRGTNEPHTLDLIITNEENMIDSIVLNSPLGKSDHSVIEYTYSCYIDRKNSAETKYMYDRGNYEEMRRDLGRNDWSTMLGSLGVEEQWHTVKNVITSAVDKHIPKMRINDERHTLPVNKESKSEIKKKHRMWSRFIETRDEEKKKDYNRQRNKVRKITRKAQKDKETKIANESKHNPKKFWNYVKSKLKTKPGISELLIDETGKNQETTKTDEEKAEVLSKFFTSVFTEEPDGNLPSIEKKTEEKLEIFVITAEEVAKILKNTRIDKSAGPDGIHPRILNELSNELSQPLAMLFNKTLDEGKLPDEWKTANITAIHKKGNKKLASNYRPVSLTCLICKKMEEITRDHIMKFLKKTGTLSKKQFGFIAGRSTVLQLLKVMDEWTKIIDEGGEIDVIFMDFMKAFDKVPHRRLILKLKSYGIDGPLLNWIEDFLKNRKQRVVVNGCKSEWKNVASGVPQGSVIGPLLFVVYINDLPEVVEAEVYLFADDTKIFCRIVEDGISTLQEDLNRLQNWSDTWLLKFHPDKCKVMNLHRGKKTNNRKYFMKKLNSTTEDKELDKVAKEKDLGIITDENLKFEEHIQVKVNKATKVMGLIRRSFTTLDTEMFRKLFTALVRPHLEYGQAIWSPIRKKDIISIENVLRRASKQVPQLKDLEYPERLKKLNLPTMKYRRHRGDMIELYKIMNEHYDPEVAPHPSRREGTTRGHSLKIFKERCRTRLRQNHLLIRAVDAWNHLPENVVTAASLDSFKNRLDKLWSDHPVKFHFEAPLKR